ncbi:ryanodine receptor 3-like protein [Lates japonicus]|uniref:Ryanodine receptor 3-like protein n=1 Tax=Lates japonicus TaxID=270547 RepID=A0AAD3MZV1_LATJO|nr:ryanodine receptor 3-like protein [Lates japonicus]
MSIPHYNNFFLCCPPADIKGFKIFRHILSLCDNASQRQCYPFHMYAGQSRRHRDEIEDPAGDPDEPTARSLMPLRVGEETSRNRSQDMEVFPDVALSISDEIEHTGQESYVWKMYQERLWDFFPAGDCFSQTVRRSAWIEQMHPCYLYPY